MDDRTVSLAVSVEQLDRYFANELPLPEAERVRARLNANPDIARAATAMRKLWEPVDLTPSDTEVGWSQVIAQLDSQSQRPNTPISRLHKDPYNGQMSWRNESVERRPHYLRWVTAALACFVVGAAGVLFTSRSQTSSNQTDAEGHWKMYRTARGQHAEVRLADGTKVTIAPESNLKVRQDGPLASRDVGLVGQAFFIVVPHPKRPFVVRTRHGVTEELGTSFSVTAYPDDSATRVVVADGRVAMWASKHEGDIRARTVRVVPAGAIASITATGVSELTYTRDVTQELRWLRRELVFQNVTLGEIMTTLERWYDIEVSYKDPTVRNFVLTVTVTDDPVDETLRVITRSLNLRFERRGNVVHILDKIP